MEDTILEELEEIESEDSTLTLEERFDVLAQSLIMNAWEIIKRIRKKGERADPDEEYRQNESLRQFKIISGVYASLKKNNRISDKPNEHFDEQLLQKIKAKKGSIGDIIRDVPFTKIEDIK